MHTSLQATYKYGGSGVAGGRPTLTIGLFCSKTYYHQKLVNEFIQEKNGIDPSKVTKTVIKRGKFKVYVGAEAVVDTSLKHLDEYMSGPCRYCIDYTAELADISVGAIGSPDGWNTVIVRTEVGKRLFESARKANVIDASPVDASGPSLGPLIKLSTKKKLQNNAYYLRRGVRPERLIPR
jgi:coenzyme F420 hydrogenase subunit beta